MNTAGLTAGSIVNNGTINDSTGAFTADIIGATSGADITNTGVINEAANSFTANAGSSTSGHASGNFNNTNTGVINFTAANSTDTDSVAVTAANVNFAGSVNATLTPATKPTALSAQNYLSSFTLYSGYDLSSSTSNYTGVVDFASSIYANDAEIDAGAARILSGGIYSPVSGGQVNFYLGTGKVADPFTNTTLANNLSLFPKTTVQADNVYVYGTETTASTVGSNVNLDGVLSTQLPASVSSDNYIDIKMSTMSPGPVGSL